MKRKTKNYLVIVGLTAAVWTYSHVAATLPAWGDEGGNGDLHRFLPNDGNTAYTTGELLRVWPPEGPKELWNVEVGHGLTMVLYWDAESSVDYMQFDAEGSSGVMSLPTGESLSHEQAVALIRSLAE